MYARGKLLDPVPVWYSNSFYSAVELARIDRLAAACLVVFNNNTECVHPWLHL